MGKKYNLSKDKIKKLANVFYLEQGNSIAGVKACATHLCNYYEKYMTKKYSSPFECLLKSGWWSNESSVIKRMNSNSASQTLIDATDAILNQGERTLPSYCDEYDCLSDVRIAYNYGKRLSDPQNRSLYIKDVTKITNVYGSTYTFYCFPDGIKGTCDAFGYINKSTNTKEGVNEMTKTEKAIQWMENLASDNSHGYDQIYRWGEKGDYDCSSAVITAWQTAGVPVKTKGATYTGNMYNVFLKCGFKDVTSSITLSSGKGLKRGDILLNHKKHVAMYCGNGKEVQASINEKGGATYGSPGDQTGRQILIRPYRNYPWNVILRYQTTSSTTNSSSFVPDELKKGSIGEKVKDLQHKLNQLGFQLEQDGIFGNLTYNAVINFQQKNSLVVDGIVGVKTLTKIDTLLSSSKTLKSVLWVGKVKTFLNVRSGAGKEYNNITSWPVLNKDNLIDVCGTEKANDGSLWYYICIDKRIYGYVDARYIERV